MPVRKGYFIRSTISQPVTNRYISMEHLNVNLVNNCLRLAIVLEKLIFLPTNSTSCMERSDSLPCSQTPPLDAALIQFNRVHVRVSYFEDQFNYTFLKWSHPLKFYNKNFVYISVYLAMNVTNLALNIFLDFINLVFFWRKRYMICLCNV